MYKIINDSFVNFTLLGKDCERFPKVLHGKTTYYYEGAVAITHCDEGFSLNGSPHMYCGGKGWNDTNPECQGKHFSHHLT